MKINTGVLVSAENEFKSYKGRITTINEDIKASVSVIASLKGIDGVGVKLRKISLNLDETSSVLSEMSCLLEMAAETYSKTEEELVENSTYLNKCSVGFQRVRSAVRFPEYINLYPDSQPNTVYIIKESKISGKLNDVRKNYFTNSFVGADQSITNTYCMNFGSRAASVISTIGKIQEDK